MALLITDECIHCGACPSECPNNAIYENGEQWSFAEGTELETIELEDGSTLNADTKFDPIKGGEFGADGDRFFYIVADKCTECKGFHEEPACAIVCPTDCCVPDPDREESEEELFAKKAWLHGE